MRNLHEIKFYLMLIIHGIKRTNLKFPENKRRRASPVSAVKLALRVAKHSLLTFLNGPRETNLINFSFRVEIHPVLILIICNHLKEINHVLACKKIAKIFQKIHK